MACRHPASLLRVSVETDDVVSYPMLSVERGRIARGKPLDAMGIRHEREGSLAMDIKKILANAEGKGTLVCAQCGNRRIMDVAYYSNVGKPLKVKCSCGHVFFVSIEVRKFYRKHTKFAGEYILVSKTATPTLEKGRMRVEDLSRTGLGFRTYDMHNIHVQDLLRVRFVLDDPQHSNINKSAVVRRVEGFYVGAEFLDFDAFDDNNRTLGFYLMPK